MICYFTVITFRKHITGARTHTHLYRLVIYLFPDKRSAVAEGVTVERPMLNVDFCLNEDGSEEQLTKVKRGVLQALDMQPSERGIKWVSPNDKYKLLELNCVNVVDSSPCGGSKSNFRTMGTRASVCIVAPQFLTGSLC